LKEPSEKENRNLVSAGVLNHAFSSDPLSFYLLPFTFYLLPLTFNPAPGTADEQPWAGANSAQGR
jgi:hypothetical protein